MSPDSSLLVNSNTCGLNGLKISPARSDLGMRIKASHRRYRDTMDATISICNEEILKPGCKFATLILRLIRVNENGPWGSEKRRENE